MAKISSINRRVAPESFRQYCRTRFDRTVELTQKAIAALQAQGQSVTLDALSGATCAFDAKGKGLSANTILRNPQAAELFRQHSSVYQARKQKARKATRKRPQPSSEVRAIYRGLRPREFIQMVEDLKTQIVDLKAQCEKLETQRDAAYRLRDQALQQNTRQLALLTQSTNPLSVVGNHHEP
jgi:hypothetical protein